MLWRPSPTETTGDPFFQVASQPTITDPVTGIVGPNPLYDPNYRQFDVEGYRIYRGRVDSPNELALIAQFDYQGTFITDFTSQVSVGVSCRPAAPELGIDMSQSSTRLIPPCRILPSAARCLSIPWFPAWRRQSASTFRWSGPSSRWSGAIGPHWPPARPSS